MTANEAYSRAKQFLLLFAIAAISGAVVFFFGRSMRWMDTVLLIALGVALVGGAIGIAILYAAVGFDERLNEKQVRQMRLKLLLFGPLGALEILMSSWDRTAAERRR